LNQAAGVILVTTDGSAHSRRVLPHAAAFAKARGDRIALLQVLEGEATEPVVFAELVTTLRNGGIDGTPLVATLQDDESVARAIVRVAGEQDAALIAMDTRGHGALHHALQGSTALEVLSLTERPVFLTGAELADAPATEPYRVLVCTDGSPASRDVIRALGPLLAPGSFAVTLLQVHERDPNEAREAEQEAESQQYLESLRTFFAAGLDIRCKVRVIPRLGGVDTTIIDEARSEGARCLALSSHGTTAARHLFAGSTSLQLLGRSPLPMIMARGAE
jgi:nucleotide-binding universal stress UspA family protein